MRTKGRKPRVDDAMIRRGVSLALLAGWFLVQALGPAVAQMESEGRMLAERWCAGCHVVDRVPGGTDAAPPFRAMANDPAYTPGRLKGWLIEPHPPMPNLNLTRREIDAIVAYIRSLRN
jgi:mono/diheme cytochrome c family protein